MDGNLITIELFATDLDDGRTYITSKMLEGFRYILEPDESPDVMKNDLLMFMKAYFKAEVKRLSSAETPRSYRQLSIEPKPRRKTYNYVAELSAIAA